MNDDESFKGTCPTCGQCYHPPRTVTRNPKKPVLNIILDELDRLEASRKHANKATLNVAAFNALAEELYLGPVERICIAHPGGILTITPEDM